MLVRELLKEFHRYADDDAFEAAFPEPALLLEPFGEHKGGSVDTPSQPLATRHSPLEASSTEVMGALEAARHMARMSEAVHPDARLAWLKKSERNPFGALITAGRARNNDVVIEHTTVSKLHVIFTKVGAGWNVSDEGSSNGTFLNGMKLTPREKRPISDGDSLRLGPDIVARFFEPGSLWQFCAMLRVGKG
ncbi:MAG: FHA domain-containing protein [Planctomycetota bacterium]|nr:FHA domain-containing protein [Planctomycetota bacterium]